MHQKVGKQNLKNLIAELPYIFNDPIKFDKKIDPKKLPFGSKIDRNSSQREQYFRVKKVISPELIELDTGLKIRLIGIKRNPTKIKEAMDFIKERTRGQRVFLKYDEVKYDSANNLFCYLYLSNKTFINAHLIKNKLTDVEVGINYKLKSKFIAMKDKMEATLED